MIAEKPMLSESIARLLSNGKFHKRKGRNFLERLNFCDSAKY